MAETGGTPIKGAFFGLIIMFGIFILGAWFFDHFTGRDSNAKIAVRSIAVYTPAVPDSQWGDTSHGLKCKLNFETTAPSQFIDTFICVQYENITKNDIVFLFDPNETLKAASAVNRDRWKLKLAPIVKMPDMSDDEYRKLYESSIQTIKPGQIFEGKIECQIENVIKNKGFMSGFFDVTYVLEIDENKISQFQSSTDQTLWTGKIKAGDCQIFLTMPHAGGCNDCHGDADYHHGVLQDCRFCHAEGTAILHKTCIRCHKRDDQKIYGRRRVLGPEGDFDRLSRHLSGFIKDRNCLVCHDMTRHGCGSVILADPNSPGKICEGRDTEFCLSCHNSNPPESVKFPKVPAAKKFYNTFMLPDYNTDENEPSTEEPDTSGYPALEIEPSATDSSSDSDSYGYPALEIEPLETAPAGSAASNKTENNSGLKVHSQKKGVSIYDKSDYLNSDLYKKNVECTDCHKSHGSTRPSLLKNLHGPDDEPRI
ncbi:MAG: hypothetical protein JW787_00455 [Sedimentisphaerales bacterium]|nr:hypothetical protein [Sedimentisphaerales bacterium]